MDIKSLTHLDYGVIIVYIIVLLGIGFWASFRKGHTEDLFLAGRNLGWPNIGLSIFGTNVSPSFMIASCGIAYSSGMVASNFEWLAWFFLFILAIVFVPHYLNTRVSTMPEFMQRRYNTQCRNFLSVYALFTTLWLWVAGALFIGGVMMQQVLGWPLWIAVLFLAVISTSFTVTGGLTAVVITDTFQSILIIAASAALTIIGLVKVGSLSEVIHFQPEPAYWHLFRPASDATYPWPAVVLGYPVLGIWFWCTDQTIVQRVLGGRNIRQGQLGCIFAGFLKVLMPFIFFLPGILCRILHPELDDPDKAYMMMVTQYLPPGMVGLIVAVLIAALVSTIDSGLNSFSTIFTLDVYNRMFRPEASAKETHRMGQVVTVVTAAVSVAGALLISLIEMNLFDIGQSMIGFMAPAMAAVFLIGVLWNGATATAAFLTLLIGSVGSIGIGAVYMFMLDEETKQAWPHFLLLSFYMFAALAMMMIVLSLVTKKSPEEERLPTLIHTVRGGLKSNRLVWALWGVLAVIMLCLYLIFN